MKKAALVVIMFCFLFSGCKSEKTVSPITKGIKFDLKVNYGKANYDVSVIIDNGGCMEALINSPDKISGMKITANKFETVSEYKNLKYTYNDEEFTRNNPIIMVYNILSDLSDKQLPLKEGENCVEKDEFSSKEYEFVFSPSGLPISFNMNSENLNIVFCDVIVL